MAFDIVVSGHLCADLLPETSHTPLSALASPGKLFEVGALAIATGGAVSNTGLALQRLGVPVALMTTVGDDLLGQVIIAGLKDRDPHLGDYIRLRQDTASSYSVILSPQNADRIILHCPGSNANFDHGDLDYGLIGSAKMFHLGYPPLLPRLYARQGESLLAIYRRVHDLGVITSLDFALPDPDGPSGQVDWRPILERVLPYVDVFLPSLEEIMFMLRRSDYETWQGALMQHVDRDYLRDLAEELLALGTAISGLKLGEYGLYLRTTAAAERLQCFQGIGLDLNAWRNCDCWRPAFEVQVIGTTGAGDCAYAAFLAALLRGLRTGGSAADGLRSGRFECRSPRRHQRCSGLGHDLCAD